LFLASLPSGFPRNPNVLLIRTHPNPFPSVANKEYLLLMNSGRYKISARNGIRPVIFLN
jgi:hypothetical protein